MTHLKTGSSVQFAQEYLRLKTLCGTPMPPALFLPLAINIAQVLGDLHQQNRIHKGLSPDRIFFNPQTYAATFSPPKTTQHIGETESPSNTQSRPEDSLAYISPEQTGRTNQAIDFRSDLYSLGIILYQLLTGKLPFQADDAIGWVHCHIARMPQSPSIIYPSVPATLSDLVMKLLSKKAEERYQTASALRSDLSRCLKEVTATGEVNAFPLGEDDIPAQILLPAHLYGREESIETLLASFERVSLHGHPEMLVIDGYSGVGKTSLVRELYELVARKQGQFIAGKFDQYKRNIPYLTFADAFRELIRQILAGSQDQINHWRGQLQQTLGKNAQLIIDIIPRLELIMGPQTPVEPLPPQEAQHRFTKVFQQFITVFATKDHSLAIFLDDLQWADPASLKLLEEIIATPETRFLLVIGAYRDNEVDPVHPLMLMLDRIRKTSVRLQTLSLSPLSLSHLGQMMGAIFHATQRQLEPLTDLVYQKTAGNPFFIIQFLKSLHSEGLVTFDDQRRLWRWDIQQIQAQDYTENVVDLMTAKLKKLDANTQEVLSLAACIGNRFAPDILTAIRGPETPSLCAPLEEALQDGLIVLRPDGAYRFIHDRIQQAAYSLISRSKQPAVHLRIGRLLLEHSATSEPEEQLFDILHQLNLGGSLLTERQEKYQLARLNLRAGKKAKKAIAYNAARDYFNQGAQQLDDNSWSTEYAMTFELFKELAEAESLNSNYTAAKQLIDLLLSLAKTTLEKAELYNTLIVQDTLLANYQEAIQSGREALRLLGIIVPGTNLQEELTTLLASNQQILGDRPIASLIDAAEMSDPGKIASLELLSNMVVPARYTNSRLFALISVLNVNLSLRFGLTAKSTVGYTAYGMVLNSEMGQYQEALEFGELSLRLSERFNAPAQKCQACFMLGHYLNHWVRPLAMADALLEEGAAAGLASGEMQWTGYIFAYKLFQPFYRGVQPEQILAEIPKLLLFTRKTKNQWATDTLLGLQLALGFLCKTGQTDTAAEEHFYSSCDQHRSFGAKGRYLVLKMQILFLYGQEQEALAMAPQAQELLGFFSSSISVAAYFFYHSLILAAACAQANDAQKNDYLARIQSNQQQMKIWADNCAENFAHQYLLVEAELSRIAGQELESERLFQQAIDSAQQNGLIHDEGLAYELASRFYWQRGFKLISDSYLRAARNCYQQWGASGKVRQLDQLFPALVKRRNSDIDLSNSQFDAIAVIKASQAISDKILLDDLLDTLMRILLENAGANRGCLILPEDNELKIAVTAQVSEREIQVQQQGESLSSGSVPLSLINYVQRTRENIILDDTTGQGLFTDDPYLRQAKPESVLCMPILRQSNLLGLLYLENNLARGIFTPERVKVLELLSSQAAISLENAILYREQGRAEEALWISNEKYRAIFENSGTALGIIEEDTTLSICNQEFLKLAGARKSDVEGHLKWSDFVANADDLRRMQEYHQLRRIDPTSAPKTYEFKLRTQNDRLKDIIVSVTNIPGTTQTLASLLDITERKQAEEKVVMMATIIDQAAEGIILTDKNWVIQYTNPAFLRMTGYSHDEIIGQRTNLLKSEAHDENFYRNIRDTILRGDIWSGRIINKKKDGTPYEVDATGSPVRDDAGEIVNFVGIQRDITKEIILETQLRQSQKMEAIGALAGGIAHDFNNILAAILGYAQLMSNKLPNDSNLQRYLEQILGASHRATDLVKQILTYSRQTKPERKPVQLDQLAREVLKLIRASIPTSIAIMPRITIDPEDAVSLADETQIHQVLMNLCSNAAHAMRSSGGLLTLSLSSVVADAETAILFPDLPLATYIKLRVADTGHGIEPESLERIFDPYFTTKSVGEGTGLGLSVVQGILEGHGGRISVDSEPGIGTSFTLLLPKLEIKCLTTLDQERRSTRGTEQILFVDDEENLTALGQEMLEELGYQVTATTSSLEAIEIFAASPDRFNLVITDRTMPELGGEQLAIKVRELNPRVPIILCTGFSGDLALFRKINSGIDEIILKPYTIEQISSQTRELIDRNRNGTE